MLQATACPQVSAIRLAACSWLRLRFLAADDRFRMTVQIIRQCFDGSCRSGELFHEARQIRVRRRRIAAEHIAGLLERALRCLGAVAQALDERLDLRLSIRCDLIKMSQGAIELLYRVT